MTSKETRFRRLLEAARVALRAGVRTAYDSDAIAECYDLAKSIDEALTLPPDVEVVCSRGHRRWTHCDFAAGQQVRCNHVTRHHEGEPVECNQYCSPVIATPENTMTDLGTFCVFRGGYIEAPDGSRWWNADLLKRTEEARDEALRERDSLTEARGHLRRELHACKAKLEAAQTALVNPQPVAPSTEGSLDYRRLVEAQRERDEARAEAMKLTRERDTYSAVCEKLRGERDSLKVRLSIEEEVSRGLLARANAAEAHVKELIRTVAAISLTESDRTGSDTEKLRSIAKRAHKALYGGES
jgi:hypothetical protein